MSLVTDTLESGVAQMKLKQAFIYTDAFLIIRKFDLGFLTQIPGIEEVVKVGERLPLILYPDMDIEEGSSLACERKLRGITDDICVHISHFKLEDNERMLFCFADCTPLETMTRQWRKVNVELGNFVYRSSHDLRSPLRTILGLVHLSRIDSAKVGECLDYIQQTVMRLDSFVSSLKDYMENMQDEEELRLIDFTAITLAAHDHAQYLDRSNRFKIELQCEGVQNFYTYHGKVCIVFENLVSNAIKYQNPQAHIPLLKINIYTDEEKCVISFKDNGIGIEHSSHQHLFGMFYRASENSNGSGLGLYVVKQAVEKLKGSIHFNSSYGLGTEFIVELPNLRRA